MEKIILNVLRKAQDEHGYLSEHVLKQLTIEHDIPLARLYGVVKFYAMLRTELQGKNVIEICGSPSCVLNDSTTLEKFFEEELGIKIGETTKDNLFSLYKTSCIGCCDEAPAMLVNGKPHTQLTVERIRELIARLKQNADTE